MRRNQTNGFDTVVRFFTTVGLAAVVLAVMLALAWPAWDVATQEFVRDRIVPVVGFGVLSLPLAGLMWLVPRLGSR